MESLHLRFRAFSAMKVPFSLWARRRRMEQFLKAAKIHKGMSVLDLGGYPDIWSYPFIPSLKITILNLPGSKVTSISSQHTITYIEGDGCNVSGVSDKSFDLVFSNSVIEHVGGADRRAAFAKEVRRIGKSYYVQTPSIWFPIEAHNGMPLWWFYPHSVRNMLIRRWRKKLPEWTEMVEGTTVVKRSELKRLFPESTIVTESVLGVPKSYSVFSVPR
jgi:hypothetical protein